MIMPTLHCPLPPLWPVVRLFSFKGIIPFPLSPAWMDQSFSKDSKYPFCCKASFWFERTRRGGGGGGGGVQEEWKRSGGGGVDEE